jgi:hypothetical protein
MRKTQQVHLKHLTRVIDMTRDTSPAKDHNTLSGIDEDRRKSERRKVTLPAFIGDAHADTRDFETGTVLDISLGGIRFSIPKGTTVELRTEGDANELSVIFTLPNNHWRTNVICRPQRVFESANKVQIGAAVLNPDYFYTKSLHSYDVIHPYKNI